MPDYDNDDIRMIHPQPESPFANAWEFPPDIASPEGVEEQLRQRDDMQRDRAGWWRGLMMTQFGRAELWRLIAGMHAFEDRLPCTPAGFPHTEAMWFQFGQKKCGTDLYHFLAKLDRGLVLQMHAENDPAYNTALPDLNGEPN